VKNIGEIYAEDFGVNMKNSVKKWFNIGKPRGKLESTGYVHDVAREGQASTVIKFGLYNDNGIKNVYIMDIERSM
jgi:hypothetical protein